MEKQYISYNSDMDFNPDNQQLSWLYRKGYHFLNKIMILDMIQRQERNKLCECYDTDSFDMVILMGFNHLIFLVIVSAFQYFQETPTYPVFLQCYNN